ncbi:hypothetical protein V1477_018073 [Vespula maculifrons]|uniref:Uncharacterized protein n=1 Tax=Vespula maculifrons TaxID=7453 RepID=A0ABD2B075_VESMC
METLTELEGETSGELQNSISEAVSRRRLSELKKSIHARIKQTRNKTEWYSESPLRPAKVTKLHNFKCTKKMRPRDSNKRNYTAVNDKTCASLVLRAIEYSKISSNSS